MPPPPSGALPACRAGRRQSAPTPQLSSTAAVSPRKRKRPPTRRRARGRRATGIFFGRSRPYIDSFLPCSDAAAGVSANSETSTEMLCLIGFQLHFLTSATSAIGM